MATPNYRQAKRSREESRKKRKQEKMLRKASRVETAEPAPDVAPGVVEAANKVAP